MTSEIEVFKLYHDLKVVSTDQERVAIVRAHDDAIRREVATKSSQAILVFGEADKIGEWYSPMIRKELAVAIIMESILGTEPAREES